MWLSTQPGSLRMPSQARPATEPPLPMRPPAAITLLLFLLALSNGRLHSMHWCGTRPVCSPACLRLRSSCTLPPCLQLAGLPAAPGCPAPLASLCSNLLLCTCARLWLQVAHQRHLQGQRL